MSRTVLPIFGSDATQNERDLETGVQFFSTPEGLTPAIMKLDLDPTSRTPTVVFGMSRGVPSASKIASGPLTEAATKLTHRWTQKSELCIGPSNYVESIGFSKMDSAVSRTIWIELRIDDLCQLRAGFDRRLIVFREEPLKFGDGDFSQGGANALSIAQSGAAIVMPYRFSPPEGCYPAGVTLLICGEANLLSIITACINLWLEVSFTNGVVTCRGACSMSININIYVDYTVQIHSNFEFTLTAPAEVVAGTSYA